MKTITSIIAVCFFAMGTLISQNNLEVEGDAVVNDKLGVGSPSTGAKVLIQQSNNERAIRLESLNSNTDLAIQINNNGGTHYIFDDADDGHSLDIESANDLVFNTGGPTERMRINDSGLVAINLIGNSTSRLGVGSLSNQDGIYVTQWNNTSNAWGVYSELPGGGTAAQTGVYGGISQSSGTGNTYGIYGFASTTPSNFWAVYANGDIWYSGSMKAPSDIRLKKNIQDIEPVLDKVMQLQTKTYEFDRDTYHYANLANGVQHGFIAQNVQELFPTLVEEERHSFTIGEDEETGERTQQELNILGMSSIEMIPILTKAIQEQQDIIEDLKSRIETLENE